MIIVVLYSVGVQGLLPEGGDLGLPVVLSGRRRHGEGPAGAADA